uniref:Uncharacterized protein n=1 Tax=Anguilla anguilla TaxID=7936 RepID=A0A0E9TF76_ANGAN
MKRNTVVHTPTEVSLLGKTSLDKTVSDLLAGVSLISNVKRMASSDVALTMHIYS